MDKKMFISIIIIILMITIGFYGLIYYNYESRFNSNEPFISNSITSINNTPLHKMGPYGHYYRGWGNLVKSIKLWTPVILLNSPYKGCAKASSDQSFNTKYDIASHINKNA